jgi:hypothetical protein
MTTSQASVQTASEEALPEYLVKVTREHLVRRMPGFPVKCGLLNPGHCKTLVPRRATAEGRTVQDLMGITGKHCSTIRRQLTKLLDLELVCQESQRKRPLVWWLLRPDPDKVANRYEIPCTAELRRGLPRGAGVLRGALIRSAQVRPSHLAGEVVGGRSDR